MTTLLLWLLKKPKSWNFTKLLGLTRLNNVEMLYHFLRKCVEAPLNHRFQKINKIKSFTLALTYFGYAKFFRFA